LIQITPTHSLERVSSQNLGCSPLGCGLIFCPEASSPHTDRATGPRPYRLPVFAGFRRTYPAAARQLPTAYSPRYGS
jgi:hypothetical protein